MEIEQIGTFKIECGSMENHESVDSESLLISLEVRERPT